MAMITIRGGMKATGKYVFPRFPMYVRLEGFIERMLESTLQYAKNMRTVGELQTHINMNITGSRRAVVMDYLTC